MNRFVQVIFNSLGPVARINGGISIVLDKLGRVLRAVDTNEVDVEPKQFDWLSSMIASCQPSELTIMTAPDGRKLWLLPLQDAYFASLEVFPSERSEALKKIFLEALPYIAKVTGGEAVLFDGSGQRIASRDSDGIEVKERLIHSPLAQKAMKTMKPVFGPSVMDEGHVAVRIPIAPELGIGFSNFFAVKYKKVAPNGVESTSQITIDSIIGNSAELADCKNRALRIAAASSTTVVYGETGTGKELFVHAIHNQSSRSNGPFVAVNCGGIPENLIETLFFGYEGGAFTGAKREGHQGVFEQANGGTLFLDEIGEMDLPLQAHFLRVLQDSEIVRVGGKKRIPVNVRVFAATNRNLSHLVQQGLFRQDLYYRLNVLELNIPPLRERLDDIPDLVNFFIAEFRTKIRTDCSGISAEALACLQGYNWPGNIRELRNIVERSISLSDSEVIQPSDLPAHIAGFRRSVISTTKPVLLKNVTMPSEKEAIIDALMIVNGNRRLAAERLGISTTTLWRRMIALNIETKKWL